MLELIKHEKKNLPMAQTTPDASFGPVFPCSTLHHPHVTHFVNSIHQGKKNHYKCLSQAPGEGVGLCSQIVEPGRHW